MTFMFFNNKPLTRQQVMLLTSNFGLFCHFRKLPIKFSMSTLIRRRAFFNFFNQFKRFNSNIAKKMEDCGVVPEVIDDAPPDLAQVIFSINYKADLGNKLTPTIVKNPPKVSWKSTEGALYTLAVVDPDAPSRDRATLREWKHWLVGNIPGINIDKGDVLAAYIGAGPPKGTGLHRYVYLIYKQKEHVKFFESRLSNGSADGRAGFCIRRFAQKYKLGNPIAGNFFVAEYDDYVPQLYKQLGL